MNEKMDKILKVVGIIGIVLFAISLISAFFGFLMNSETFFYTAVLFLFSCFRYVLLYIYWFFNSRNYRRKDEVIWFNNK